MSGDLHRFARARTGDSQPEQPVSSQAVFKDLSSPGTVAFRKPKNVLSGMGSAPTPSGSGARAMQEQPKPPQLSLVQMAGAGASMGLADLKSSALPTGTGSLFAVGAAAAGGNRGSLLGASTLSGTPARTALTSLSLAPPSVMAASASMPVPSLSSSSTLGLLSTAPTPAVVASPAPVVASTAGVSADALERLVEERIKYAIDEYHERIMDVLATRQTKLYDESAARFMAKKEVEVGFAAAEGRFQKLEAMVQSISDRFDGVESQIQFATYAQSQQELSISTLRSEMPVLVQSCVDKGVRAAQTAIEDTLRNEIPHAGTELGKAFFEVIKTHTTHAVGQFGVAFEKRLATFTTLCDDRLDNFEADIAKIRAVVDGIPALSGGGAVSIPTPSTSPGSLPVPTTPAAALTSVPTAPTTASPAPAAPAAPTVAAAGSSSTVGSGGSAPPASAAATPTAAAASSSTVGSGGSAPPASAAAPPTAAAASSSTVGSGGSALPSAGAPAAAAGSSSTGGSGGSAAPASAAATPAAAAPDASAAATSSTVASGDGSGPPTSAGAAVSTTPSSVAGGSGGGSATDPTGSGGGATSVTFTSFQEVTEHLTSAGSDERVLVQKLVEWARTLYKAQTGAESTTGEMLDWLNRYVSPTPVDTYVEIPDDIELATKLDPGFLVPPKRQNAGTMISRVKGRLGVGVDKQNEYMAREWGVVLSQVLVFKNDPEVAAILAYLRTGTV